MSGSVVTVITHRRPEEVGNALDVLRGVAEETGATLRFDPEETEKHEIEGDGDLSTYDTKEEAVQAGREEARRRQTEHVIHDADGSIAERSSYGSDPADVPG